MKLTKIQIQSDWNRTFRKCQHSTLLSSVNKPWWHDTVGLLTLSLPGAKIKLIFSGWMTMRSTKLASFFSKSDWSTRQSYVSLKKPKINRCSSNRQNSNNLRFFWKHHSFFCQIPRKDMKLFKSSHFTPPAFLQSADWIRKQKRKRSILSRANFFSLKKLCHLRNLGLISNMFAYIFFV